MMGLDSSRFRYLLATNDEPLDVEAAEVRKIVALRQANLAQLEGRITEVTSMLNSLTEYRNREASILSRIRAIVSPIRRLPPEILIKIFMLLRKRRNETNRLYDFWSVPGGPLPGPLPLSITHVCSEWRRVSLATPSLWTALRSRLRDYDPSIPNNDPDHDECLQTLLARTGAYHPLDITLSGPPVRKCAQNGPLSFIHPYMHRIAALDLGGRLCALPIGSFNILARLSMTDDNLHHDVNIHQTTFPSLRRVLLEYSDVLNLPSFIPWRQLTHLSLYTDSVDLSALRVVLSQSTALIKLHVSFTSLSLGNSAADLLDAHREPVVIPQLETLIIDGDVKTLLPCLTLPGLTTVDIMYGPWLTSIYGSFESRSSFSLQWLTLRAPKTIETADIIKLIRTQRSLIEINSDLALDVTPAMEELMFHDLAPNLEYLRMRLRRGNKYDDNAVLNMLSSRDPSQNSAFVSDSPPNGRIFKSHVFKRLCEAQPPDPDDDIEVDGEEESEIIHIYF
ncbi:hypothetical protein Hypma_004106 [Hypsizygus marmoreus]|uniref:Uncharacterized protein n=1 Tax=Hypsizygus marmoreus TaxID=39966 RepID=A0A369K481_HYPMA|nr:hypothetical protein Hypma_004106 [Hypsizygus marmoreus]